MQMDEQVLLERFPKISARPKPAAFHSLGIGTSLVHAEHTINKKKYIHLQELKVWASPRERRARLG
jgi:hypothetical protein